MQKRPMTKEGADALQAKFMRERGNERQILSFTILMAILLAIMLMLTREAHSAISITVSGTLYSDEGTTPVSGQTLRLVVMGGSAGTDTTDINGDYSITTTITPTYVASYIPLLVYVDDSSVDATTVTAMDSTINSATISDLDLYVDHLITRRDAGSAPLNTGDMSNAKISYSDADILYSISWPNTTVTGTNTKLYVPSGHGYTPYGDVTSPHMQIEGTLTGGSNTFTVSGNFKQSSISSQVEANSSTIIVGGNFSADGTIDSTNYNNATLVMNGTGSLTYSNLSNPWSWGFRNLTVGQSNNVTTVNNIVAVIGQLEVGSGRLNAYSIFLRGATPLVVHADSTIEVNFLRFFGNGIQELPPLNNGYDSNIRLASNGTIVRQTGNITINGGNSLILNGDTLVNRAVTYDTNNFDLTVGGGIQVGQGGDTAQKRLDITNSIVTVGGNIDVRSGSVQADIISTGSTVILNGAALQTITTNNSDFNDLTVNNASTSGVNFVDSFAVNNFTNTTANSTMTFAAGQTYTINGAATLQGASGQLITLASSSPGTHWNFLLNSGASKAIDHVNVSWSDASGSHTTQKPILPTNSNNGGNNIDWFGTNITVNKTSTLISDPINGTSTAKNHIPGAIVEYRISTTNLGDSSPDANSITITDILDSNVEYEVSSIGFTAQNSGLILGAVTYSHKNTPTVYSYIPSGTYDPNVAGIKIATSAVFNHSDTPSPNFTVTYRVRIK